MSINLPIGVSGHHRTAAAVALGTTKQTTSKIVAPVHGPAMKPTMIAAKNDRAHITASAPPDGMKNSRTRKTRPSTSSRIAQVTGVMRDGGQGSGVKGLLCE